MIRTMLAIFAFLFATPVQGAERRFTVSGFEKVQVEGPFQVVLTTGRSPGAVATGSTQALDRVSVAVEGRTLRIRPNRSVWGSLASGGDEGGVTLAVSTHELSGVSVAGSGGLRVDKAKSMRFDIALSGSGRISVAQLDVDRLELQVLGAGGVSLAGRTKTMRATITGQSGLDAAGLVAEDAEISADTTGAVALGARRSAKVTATGAGDVEIGGTPACTVRAIGAGRVRCGK
jgi:hypothetical protein